MTEEKEALVRHRLRQAEDSIKEAEVLLTQGMSARSVVNRLYYALFYSVLALLQERDLGTSKHSGAVSLFDREFVRTGIFPPQYSKALHRAFELRQRADYMEQAEVLPSDIDELLPEVRSFVESIKRYLLDRKGSK